jgi:two-component system, LytTR family, response regulator LytT
MKINVALLEDEDVYANHLGNNLLFWAKKQDVILEPVFFSKENAFTQALCQGVRFDAAFMDIYLPDGNGMDAAKQIRKIDPFMPIIFTTRSMEYARERYDVWAMQYLIKPVAYYDIALCMDRVIQLKRQHAEIAFTYKSEGVLRVVAYNDIYFFKSSGHYIEMHTRKGKHLFRGNLNTLEQELPGQFLRCNRSTIMNFSYLYSYDAKTNGKNIILATGESLAVGDYYAKKVKEKCMEMFL